MNCIQSHLYHSQKVLDSKNVIVVLRHAHRQEFPAGTFGHLEPLSTEGKKAAENLGRSIAKIPLGEIHSSPLTRCLQTSVELLKGAKQKLPITSSSILGDPGVFIKDPVQAGPFFLQMPLTEITKKMVEGKESIPGMRSLNEGGKLFLKYIRKITNFPCFMITHDILICLLCCFFFRSKEAQNFFPLFLEGFALQKEGRGFSIVYRNRTVYYEET